MMVACIVNVFTILFQICQSSFLIANFCLARFAALALAGAGCGNETTGEDVTDDDKTLTTKQPVEEQSKSLFREFIGKFIVT